MSYVFNKDSKTFTATLDVKEECGPPECEKQHPGLSACETKSINMSHSSCEPPFQYRLEVPPGRRQLLSICVFTTTAWFCVWHVGRGGAGWGGGRAALLTQ